MARKNAKPARGANGKLKGASAKTKKKARTSPAARETSSSSVVSGEMKSLITRAWFNRQA